VQQKLQKIRKHGQRLSAGERQILYLPDLSRPVILICLVTTVRAQGNVKVAKYKNNISSRVYQLHNNIKSSITKSNYRSMLVSSKHYIKTQLFIVIY